MILKLGSTGENVKILQDALNHVGNYALKVDGDFGPVTERAVKAFQSEHGLKIDGVVGAATEAKLQALLDAGNGDTPPVNAPSGEKIKGVDVYHGNTISSWKKAKDAGIEFAYLKASQGLSTDDKYGKFKTDAEAAGLITGPYHFISFTQDVSAQAKHFAALIRGLKKTDLPPCLDFEYLSGRSPRVADASVAREFLTEIKDLTGRMPIIYLSRSVPGEIGAPAFLKDYPLWLASYNSVIKVPAPWTTWKLWQFTDKGTVPGMSGDADINYFNGNLAELKSWIATT